MQLEHVNCDLCGSSEYRVRYRMPDLWLKKPLFEFPVVECSGCGLVYVNPRPTMESMSVFYPQHYHEGRDTQAHLDRYRIQSEILPPVTGKTVLDVRTTSEVENAPLAGAYEVIHIPVDDLRDRLNELDSDKPLVVTCGVGVRGHIASRILRQHGFAVQNLSGGATVRKRAWRG